jgi:dolichol kinase
VAPRRPPAIDRTLCAIELALRQGVTALTLDLEELLAAFDSGGDAVRERIAAVSQRVEQLAQDVARWPNLAGAIDRVGALLGPAAPDVPQSEAWTALRRQLGESYDALVALLAADASEPRPTNYARVAFHMGSAGLGLLATLVVFTTPQLPYAAATLAGSAWILELLRRRSPGFNATLMRFFRRISRPAEAERINSGTWYMTALVVLTLTYSPLLCVIAVSVLGFADPAAAIIGRRFGRIRLRNGRSLEGSLAFVAAGTLAAVAFVQFLAVPPAPAIAWPTALAAAIVGALAELFSRRIDDNFAIPIAALLGAWSMLAALGASAY